MINLQKENKKKIKEKKLEIEEQEQHEKKKNFVSITLIVLTVILVAAIVVQICLFVYFRNRTDDLNNKNSKLPQTSITYQANINRQIDF